MALFDFLKPVANKAKTALNFIEHNPVANTVVNKVAGVLGTPGQVAGQLTTNPEARNLAVETGQGIAKVPETVGRSFVQEQATAYNKIPIVNKALNFQKIANAAGESGQNTGARKLLYGDGSIKSYQNRYSGATGELQAKGLGNAAAPLAFLGVGLNAVGDVTGAGGEKEAAKTTTENVIEQLVKTTAENQVKKILKNKVAPEILDRVAPAIAKTEDRHAIVNILKNEIAPKVGSKVNDVVDATKAPSIVPTEAPRDAFGQITDALTGKPAAPGIAPEKGIISARKEQNALLSQERGQRFTSVGKLGETEYGSQGFYKRKAALKGEYAKVDNPYADKFTADQAENLLTEAQKKIYSTPDSVYEHDWKQYGLSGPLHATAAKFNTEVAVRKVLGMEPGLPTDSEIKLLRVHSPELAAQAENDAALAKKAGNKLFGFAAKLFGNARSAKSTLDFSMGGRQGLFVAGRHPAIWADANKESVKYAANSKYFEDAMSKIAGSDYGKLAEKYGLSLTGIGGHEEQYAATDIVGKIPGVKAAERAYTGGLTKLRADLWESRLKAYGATAAEAEQKLGEKGMKGLAEAVNTLTGRGGKSGGWISKHGTTLNEALFSPRLWASRLQPLNPAFWKRIGPAGRKEAIQNYGAFAAVASVVLGAAVAAGATVETDPRSSDFLKIKVGDTRYDILGGFQQNLVFLARQGLGLTNTITDAVTPGQNSGTNFKTYKSSQSGNLTKFGDQNGPSQLEAVFDLARNKANPVLGAAANIIEGKDKAGNAINPLTEIGQLFVPINIQQAWNSRDNPKDVLKGLPDIVGIGSQTYGIKDVKVSDKQQKYIDKLKSSGADDMQVEAVQRYFQTAKVGPNRDAASKKINDALAKGDISKAKQIANDYNKALADSFKDWKAKYGSYSDKTVNKDYTSRKIKLDSASLKTRLKNIKENQ